MKKKELEARIAVLEAAVATLIERKCPYEILYANARSTGSVTSNGGGIWAGTRFAVSGGGGPTLIGGAGGAGGHGGGNGGSGGSVTIR